MTTPKRHIVRFVILITAIAIYGCTHSGATAGSTEASEESAQGHEDHEHSEDHEHGEDHGDEQGPGELARAEPPITGPVEVGAPAPEGVENVEPAAILENPDEFRGRTVSFTGTVNGHCVHNRGWYSITVPEGSPPYLRISARPTFPVPEGVIGSTVVTHGTVDSEEFPRARVEHMEGEHGLGTVPREEDSETVSLTVIRAAGAVFTPATAE